MSYSNRYITDGLTSRNAPSLAFDRQWDDKMNHLYSRIKKTTSTIPQQAGPTYMPSLRYKPLGGHLFKQDRLHAVAKDNVKLVRRMKDIYCREPTRTEQPPPLPTSNDKRSKLSEIERDNVKLVGRLKKTKGVIDTRSYLEQYKDHCVIMARNSKRNPDRYLYKMESAELDIASLGRSPSHVRLAPVNGRRSTVGERYSTSKSDATRRSNSSLYHQEDEHHSPKRERSHRSRRSEPSTRDGTDDQPRSRRREQSHRRRRRSVDDPRGERGEAGTPNKVRDHRHRHAHQDSPPDDQGEVSHHRRSPEKRHDDDRRHRRHRRDEDGDERRDREDKHSREERRDRRDRRGSRDRENDVKKDNKELDDDFFN